MSLVDKREHSTDIRTEKGEWEMVEIGRYIFDGNKEPEDSDLFIIRRQVEWLKVGNAETCVGQ